MTLLKYIVSALIGAIIGAFAYSQFSQSSSVATTIESDQLQNIGSESSTEITSNQTSGIDYGQILKEKDLQIEALKAKLIHLNSLGNDSEIAVNQAEFIGTPMTKSMSMDDFGKNMVSAMMKDIKNVIIEPSEEEIIDLKKGFSEEDTFTEAAIQRNDDIHNYLQSINENNQFYIDNLSCGERICQLEVTSVDPQGWAASYASLVSQDWFNYMTLKEKNDDPSKFIYYIVDTRFNANNIN